MDLAGLRAARGRAARRAAVHPARERARLRLLPGDARPRPLPARGADRRLQHPARRAVRSHEGDGADVGDAHGRWHVRLRPQPARPRKIRLDAVREAAAGVRLPAAGDSVPAAADARPALGRLHRRRGARDHQHPRGDAAGARSCSSRATRRCAPSSRSPKSSCRIRSSCRGRRRARRCSSSSARRRTRCCWRRRASGRAST